MTAPLRFEDVPLPQTAFGRALYDQGRELVARGVRLDAIIWDADEVLWDWVMALSYIWRGLPRAVRTRSLLMHEEFIRIKPGIWELLWGLHHESLARGLDPYMRMWTAGYSWRLWRIAKGFPGFSGLVGPPASVQNGPESFENHPYIVTRTDTARALQEAVNKGISDVLDPATAKVVAAACAQGRNLAGLKLPSLARLMGRHAFTDARVLIDDSARNVQWFAEAGGVAIRLRHPAPHALGGRLPNMVWTHPLRRLEDVRGESASTLAHSILSVHEAGYPKGVHDVFPNGRQRHTTAGFEILIPADVLEAQWVHPMRALKGTLQAR